MGMGTITIDAVRAASTTANWFSLIGKAPGGCCGPVVALVTAVGVARAPDPQ